MTIVEVDRAIVGGVDTHLDNHVAAALDPLGALLGTESFATTPAGYKLLLSWLGQFGTVTKVGVEGTGAYGAGLARFLRKEGIDVVEVDRPNRMARRLHGKSDPLDAVEAARAALSGRAGGQAKTRDGAVEAIRVLHVAKRSATRARAKALTQMRHLTYTAPDQLRCSMKGLPGNKLVTEARRLRPRSSSDPVTSATKASLSSLAHRIDPHATSNSKHIALEASPELWPLVSKAAPCSLPPATTHNGCTPNRPGPTCAVWHRSASRHRHRLTWRDARQQRRRS